MRHWRNGFISSTLSRSFHGWSGIWTQVSRVPVWHSIHYTILGNYGDVVSRKTLILPSCVLNSSIVPKACKYCRGWHFMLCTYSYKACQWHYRCHRVPSSTSPLAQRVHLLGSVQIWGPLQGQCSNVGSSLPGPTSLPQVAALTVVLCACFLRICTQLYMQEVYFLPARELH